MTVGMAVAFAILLFDNRLNIINGGVKLLMIFVLVGCVLAMLPPFFNHLISIAHKLLRKKTIDHHDLADNKTILKSARLYFITSLSSRTSLIFIAKSVYHAIN